jgi:PilZ domain
MSNPKPTAKGEDWTRLLSDPDLLTHLGELLQTYRDSAPETRDAALLEVMRKIKQSAAKTVKSEAVPAAQKEVAPPHPIVTEPADTPPFEPDIFTPSWGQDRRRYPRMKCFVVVELLVAGSDTPIWGTLANTSLGGCLVETPSVLASGARIEIGLWVASGQIWVKGLILNGVVDRANPSFGIRVKFAEMEPSEREALRKFLRYVEATTKGYSHDHGYLAQLKR